MGKVSNQLDQQFVGYTEYNIMRELSVNEIQEVNGGNTVVVFFWGALAGGLIYDAFKFVAREAMVSTGRISTGGQMARRNRP